MRKSGIGLQGGKAMYIDRLLRIIAGAFILLSVVLAVKININWLWFTAFVGLNLFQSGFTNWCPMMAILEKLGVPRLPKGCAGE
jgi:hypothetical protein